MTARTHDLAAITALGFVLVLRPVETMTLSTLLVALFANQLGGITPDIDQPTAPFWRNLPIGGYFGRAVGKLLGGHRFLTHSLLGVALFGIAAHWLLIFLRPILGSIDVDIVWLAYMIGFLSHLVMDSFTKEGVPWLLPLPIKFGFPPLKRLRITTGKALEILVVFPGLVIVNLFFYRTHYNELLELLNRYIV